MPDCHNPVEVGTDVRGSEDVDAILCRLQSFVDKVAAARFRALPVWLGVGRVARSRISVVRARTKLKSRDTSMGKVIEFSVPDGFHNRSPEAPRKRRGKVIVFRPRVAVLDELDSDKDQSSAHLRNLSDSRV